MFQFDKNKRKKVATIFYNFFIFLELVLMRSLVLEKSQSRENMVERGLQEDHRLL